MTAHTLPGLLLERAAAQPDAVAFATKAYGLWTEHRWSDVLEQVAVAVTVLRDRGVGAGDRLLTIGDARMEFAVITLAAQFLGAHHVAAYANTSAPDLRAFLAQAAPAIVVVECVEDAGAVVAAEPAMSARIVTLQPPVVATSAEVTSRKWPVWSDEVTAAPTSERSDLAAMATELAPGTVASLLITAGTADKPRVARLTHANLLTGWRALLETLPRVTSRDRIVVDAPLAHVAGLAGALMLPLLTGCAAFFVSDADDLWGACLEVTPTVHVGPASRWVVLHRRVLGEVAVAGRLRRGLVHGAVAMNRFASRPTPPGLGRVTAAAARATSATIRRPLLAKIGARSLRVALLTGDAASGSVVRQWRELGVPVRRVYGLAETGGVLAVEDPTASPESPWYRLLAGIDARVDSTMQLEVRGDIVSPAYADDAPTTNPEGWLATGDAVELADSRVRVFGRAATILTGDAGEMMGTEAVEARLRESVLVSEAFICRPSSELTAFVRVDRDRLDSSEPDALGRFVINPVNDELGRRGLPRISRVLLLDADDDPSRTLGGTVSLPVRKRLCALATAPEAADVS